MAAFNPFGLQGDYSTSAASQANPTLLTFPWNPNYSGWSGDVAVQYLPSGTGSLFSTDGLVYPGYTRVEGLTPPSGFSYNYPPIIGVIVGFKYKPANNAITPNDTWPSYILGTELVPNTAVEVIINTDLQARYKIQFKGNETNPGVAQNFLFGTGMFGADEEYSVVDSGITYYFAKGRPNTSVGSATGGSPGTSTLYLKDIYTQANLLGTQNVIRPTQNPLFIQTPNNYDNSGWYNAMSSNPSEYENNIVTVMFNQSFMSNAWLPMLQQPANVG
jgi:hypothetical protein